MNEEKLAKIREFIIDNIVRDFDNHIKCTDIILPDNLDVLDIIVGLYDMLHKEVTGKNYDYMWHWANKIGLWCEDGFFYNRIVKGETDGKET